MNTPSFHFFQKKNIPPFTYGNFVENRPLFWGEGFPISTQSSTDFAHIDSNNDGKIDANDDLFHEQSPQEMINTVIQKAEETIRNFYQSSNPAQKSDMITSRVDAFMESVQTLSPYPNTMLPAQRANKLFQNYLFFFKELSTTQNFSSSNEIIRKNGGIMTQKRITTIPFSIERRSYYSHCYISTGEDAVRNNPNLAGYTNAAIVHFGDGKNIGFPTGIVEIFPVRKNGVITALTVLDGDGDLTTIQSSLDPNGRQQIMAQYEKDIAPQSSTYPIQSSISSTNTPKEKIEEYTPLDLPTVPVFQNNSLAEKSQKNSTRKAKPEKDSTIQKEATKKTPINPKEKKEVLSANDKIIKVRSVQKILEISPNGRYGSQPHNNSLSSPYTSSTSEKKIPEQEVKIDSSIKDEATKKTSINPEKKEVLSANDKIICEVFDGNRNPDKVRDVQKILEISPNGGYGSQTHNAILNLYAKKMKNGESIPESVQNALQIRNTIRYEISKYSDPENLKNKLMYTARIPSPTETSNIYERFKNKSNWEKFFIKKGPGKGMFVDTQNHMAYVVSGTKDNPVFHIAYTVTVGKDGIRSGPNRTPSGVYGKKGWRKSNKVIGEVLMYDDHSGRKFHTPIKNFHSQLASMTTEVLGFHSGAPKAGKPFFYGFHGTNYNKNIGVNASGGCIRMTNADIIHMKNILDGKPAVTYVSDSATQPNLFGNQNTHSYKVL